MRFTRDTISAQAHGVRIYMQLHTWTIEIGERAKWGLRLVWRPIKLHGHQRTRRPELRFCRFNWSST